MLHKETVDNATLELVRNLQAKEYLQNFYLVGGTALALQVGHRKSIDIDLFCNFNFDAQELLEKISNDFGFKILFSASNTLKGSIEHVKIDILAHRYPYVANQICIENISMLSIKDIAAMKLNAISTNGQRIKDFIDIYYILQEFELTELLNFYMQKYNQDNDLNLLKSLIYFRDVELSDWPVLIKNPKLKWSVVQKKLRDTVKILFKEY